MLIIRDINEFWAFSTLEKLENFVGKWHLYEYEVDILSHFKSYRHDNLGLLEIILHDFE